MTSYEGMTSYNDYVERESKINVAKFTLTSLTSDEVALICKYFRQHAREALAEMGVL